MIALIAGCRRLFSFASVGMTFEFVCYLALSFSVFVLHKKIEWSHRQIGRDEERKNEMEMKAHVSIDSV